MNSSRPTRTRGAVVLLFAILAAARAISFGRGAPTFLLGASAGVLLVLGIFLLLRKE